jgi:hypothetical protein
MYFVAVLVMLWNPRRPGAIAVGTVTIVLLTLTSPFGILLAPLAVVRIIVLGRDRGSVIPVAALAGTIVETVDSVLNGSRQTYTTVLPGKLVHNYLFNVAERGFFGAHYQIAAYETVGAIVVVAVVAAIALAGVARKARQCALAVLILAYSIGYYAVVLVLSGTFTGHSTGDRYYVGPFLLLAYAMVVAFDAAITADGPLRGGFARFGGFPRGGSVPRLTAAVLCAALTGCLAFSVVTDWYSHEKDRQSPTWAASLASARAWCASQPGDKAVRLRITASHPAVPWYVTLNCSQVGR